MTYDDAKRFFDRVKGRRIEHPDIDGLYFVPSDLSRPGLSYWLDGTLTKEDGTDTKRSYMVYNGFGNQQNGRIGWRFYSSVSEELEEFEQFLGSTEEKPAKTGQVCVCPDEELFNFGCKCGGYMAEKEQHNEKV